MSLTKALTAITALTATGTSDTIAVDASYRHSAYLKHVNGTGTITASASVIVQVRAKDSSTWFDLTRLAFSTTASATETRVVSLPDDATEVRFSYTAPTGSTGHSFNAEVGKITSY